MHYRLDPSVERALSELGHYIRQSKQRMELEEFERLRGCDCASPWAYLLAFLWLAWFLY